MNIDSKFNTNFEFKTNDERKEFMDLCKYYQVIMSLQEVSKARTKTSILLCHLKHILYFLYILTQSVGNYFSIVLFATASMVSLA